MVAVVLILAVFIAVIVVAVRHDRQKKGAAHEERASRARTRGWRYDLDDGPRRNYRFSGECEGLAWVLEFKSDGDGGGKTLWRMESLCAARPELLIVNPTVDKILQGRVGKFLGRLIAESKDQAEFGLGMYALPHRVETGSESFRQRFIARTQTPALARQVLDHSIQQMLLQDPHLSVAWSQRGLEIERRSQPAELETEERMIRLGCAIARHLR